MNKRLYFVVCFILFFVVVFAQQEYMYEAHQDAMEGDGSGAIEKVLGIITFALIILFCVIFVPLMIGDKIRDTKYSKKYDRWSTMLNNEAYSILKVLAATQGDFERINNNPKWREWFRKGFRDGVDNGEMSYYHDHSERTPKSQKLPWEEFSRRKFNDISKYEIRIKHDCDGDINISKFAYDEGRKQGIKRRKEKGDSKEMLD